MPALLALGDSSLRWLSRSLRVILSTNTKCPPNSILPGCEASVRVRHGDPPAMPRSSALPSPISGVNVTVQIILGQGVRKTPGCGSVLANSADGGVRKAVRKTPGYGSALADQ
ncbi:hypothetical protein Y032_0505g2672 [Ancylostoma ceylanicum]|uniref:Uncharacterized protein n=1 Tax=Ancylostoma ceylanicum TaxID=53326 RepID=A0A016WV13_9BILA|nr:hypothetical protein Y032_0505g2672 [Ancylostoma ceylanicum]